MLASWRCGVSPWILLDVSLTLFTLTASTLPIMCDQPLVPANYSIENTWWKGQYVSVGGDTIVGCRANLGGTRKWQLEYKGEYATFKGIPPYPVTKHKYIAVDWEERALVYSDEPSLFILEKVQEVDDENIFIVRPLILLEDDECRVLEDDNSQVLPSLPIGWALSSKVDETQIKIIDFMTEGAQWKFSRS